MKTINKSNRWLLGLAFALAVGVGVPVQMQAADQVKGAQKLRELNRINTVQDVQALQPGDAVLMSCPKCKTITVKHVEATFKASEPKEKLTAKHLCPGCETTLQTEGQGKAAKDVAKHVCQKCGSKDAFCCVLKKGSIPTKGMEEEKK